MLTIRINAQKAAIQYDFVFLTTGLAVQSVYSVALFTYKEAIMRKLDLVRTIAADVGLPSETVLQIVDAITATIGNEMAEGSFIHLEGLGLFWPRTEPERNGKNPMTGEPINLPAKVWPTFTTGEPSAYAIRAAKRILMLDEVATIVAAVLNRDKTAVARVVTSYVQNIVEGLNTGGKVTIEGLGTFTIQKFPGRSLKDPDTGEVFSSQPKTIYSFGSAKDLKMRLGAGPASVRV